MKIRDLLSIFAFAVSCLALSSPLFAQQPAGPSVPIAAAANLTKVFNEQIIPAFAKKTGIQILPTYGATGLLAKQLENGAPYQVFVSADVATPNKLAGEKLLDPTSIETYVIGQLALYSKSLPVKEKGLDELTSADVHSIAIANPKTAPYGAAAMETLTKLGVLDKLQPEIVYSENISQALQFGQSGNADVAFTALSLLQGQDVGGEYMIVSPKLHAPIEQALGVTPTATDAAKQFAAYLLSKDAREVFEKAGYLKPK